MDASGGCRGHQAVARWEFRPDQPDEELQLGVDRVGTGAEGSQGTAHGIADLGERIALGVVGGRPELADAVRPVGDALAPLAGADDLTGLDELGQRERAAEQVGVERRTCWRSIPKMSVVPWSRSALMVWARWSEMSKPRLAMTRTAFGSAGRPSNSRPADPTANFGATGTRRARSSASAIGERQMFPVQMNAMLMAGS
jgi:hypothetical protein